MGFLQSVKNFLFQKGYEDERYYEDEVMDEEIEEETPYVRRPRRAEAWRDNTITLPNPVLPTRGERDNIYTMPGVQSEVSTQVLICTPTDIESAAAVSDSLRQGKIVTVNMEGVEIKEAQRIMDFLFGVVYSINGDLQQVSSRTYVLSPEGVEVMEDSRNTLKANGILPSSGFKRRPR